MARFVFAFEPLLAMRRRVEELRRGAFARACAAQRDEVERGDRLRRARDAAIRTAHAAALEGRTAAAVLYDAQLRRLDLATALQRVRCAGAERAAGSARAELLAAHRERRLVERLRERRLADFQAQAARREAQEIEDANWRGPIAHLPGR